MSEEEDEYLKEYEKDMASIYRAKHFTAKQTEEYWMNRAKEKKGG